MGLSRKPNASPKPGGKPGGRRARGKAPGFLRPLRWLRIAVLLFGAASAAGVLFFRFVPVPFTPLMLIRLAERHAEGRPVSLEKTWRPLERISPRLAQAVIASEDQRFFLHHGFDWDAIGSAFTANGRGKRKLGASTISQQTAKNLFLWPDRTWLRKGLEAYFTVLIEAFWPKRRILEVYLNIIETGDGVYGAEAAARRYFQVPADGLSGAQAALIAAALPNPRAWSPARPTGYLYRRQTWILRQMGYLEPLPWDKTASLPRPARPKPPHSGNARDTVTRRDGASPPDGAAGDPATPETPSAGPDPVPADPAPPYPDTGEPVPPDTVVP